MQKYSYSLKHGGVAIAISSTINSANFYSVSVRATKKSAMAFNVSRNATF